MKSKFILFVLATCFVGNSVWATNAQIQKLIREKQQKMEQLDNCAKKVTGFKIAGISTLGLTAVGIGGNIALASKEKGLTSEIEKKQTELQTQKDNLEAITEQVDFTEREQKTKAELEEKIKNCDSAADKFWYDGRCIDPADGAFEYAKTKTNCDKANGFWFQDACLVPVVQNAHNEKDCADASGWWHDDECVSISVDNAMNLEECKLAGGDWNEKKKICQESKE